MKHLDRLEQKVDRLVELRETDSQILERNTQSLEHHVRRTDLLQSKVEAMEKWHTFFSILLKAIPLIAGLTATLYYSSHILKG